MSMKLPTRFNELLARDHGLNSLVLNALTLVEPWATDNKTVFFPEYTDHSLKHLEEVLLTAEGLILDESWPNLSSEDAAVLVLSVLLHDCALHLSEEGFFSLINGTYRSAISVYIPSEVGWPELWEVFFAEAKRFDQRRLMALFGDTTPVASLPNNKLELTYKHRLLIGEFLRRHHARLAHEIALGGIPGPSHSLTFGSADHRPILDLAGFVARSHNMGLRAAVDKLELQKRRVHMNCKVPFIMATLRIADYLQIHSARAPGKMLHLKNLASPVSRGEWKKHLSVQEINQAHDDPEAIFVDANPESAKTFIAMRRLLSDIQLELDHCWAVLGEIYGRFDAFRQLGIGIRRIRSNLDNPAQFELTRKPSYIPQDFRFRTASAELMDLLVAPLYGAKPEVGIRELVQNAVDACLEREDLIAKGVIPVTSTPAENVVVTLIENDDNTGTLVVEDHGIGMTPSIVENYFLNVGASFRSSDLWRKNHIVDGHSSIHRTGRFGIGLLAAFLLGPQIRVTTRHITSSPDSAITFTCTQGDESLEVSYCSFHHGTRIEISLNESTTRALHIEHKQWDWYCLAQPSVRRNAPALGEGDLAQEYTVPACDASLDGTAWRRIDAEGFDDVLWSYEALEGWGGAGGDNSVICNGIYICQGPYSAEPLVSPSLGIIRVSTPALVVYDPDGRFPINLQRDEIAAEHISFAKELAADVSTYLAKRLVDAFDQVEPIVSSATIAQCVDPRIPGLRNWAYGRGPLAYMLIAKGGIIPADADLLRRANIKSIVIDAANLSANVGAYLCPTICDWAECYCISPAVTDSRTSRAGFLRSTIGDLGAYGEKGFFTGLNIAGRRIVIRRRDIVDLVRPGSVPKRLWTRLNVEQEIGEWVLLSMGDVPALSLDLHKAVGELKEHKAFGFSIIYFTESANQQEPKSEPAISPFASAWLSLVGSPLLRPRYQ
ncbi:ATP-binding protein [Bordetella sp. N]|uniref:HD domain-containing protein n=1 Tax=Bordetella sp. N TaxID=1746199 RepID=UPI000A6377B3|nr:ATP-binding protein [Bordetella sp. N]